LETDRRHIRRRIDQLKREIESIKKQRAINRERRKRNRIPVVAVVGYTNAGKSSLLNLLTDSDVHVEDKLFATLDPVTRRAIFDDREALLTDTVGFIQQLPHSLVTAFRATLEEATYADLLIHVADCAHEEMEGHIKTVHRVLEEVGCEGKTVIHAFNKADLLADALDMQRYLSDYQPAALISAKTGEGVEELKKIIADLLPEPLSTYKFTLAQSDGAMLNRLYRLGAVTQVQYSEDSVTGLVALPMRMAVRYAEYLEPEI
jgi:GTP-binding protein HflX